MYLSKNIILIKHETKTFQPDDFEYDAQLDYAAKLFRQELIELKPKNVIVMTNLTWIEPILKKLSIPFEKFDRDYTKRYVTLITAI